MGERLRGGRESLGAGKRGKEEGKFEEKKSKRVRVFFSATEWFGNGIPKVFVP